LTLDLRDYDQVIFVDAVNKGGGVRNNLSYVPYGNKSGRGEGAKTISSKAPLHLPYPQNRVGRVPRPCQPRQTGGTLLPITLYLRLSLTGYSGVANGSSSCFTTLSPICTATAHPRHGSKLLIVLTISTPFHVAGSPASVIGDWISACS
jgi:hypothetical protein